MLRIRRLRLRLPPGFEDRANEIARLVGNELSELPLAQDARLDRLALPPVEAAPGAGSREVARAVAAAIGTALHGRRSAGSC